ncbi:Peptidoglycan/LPS O-acetylase OafA/YrhL, contains acyltransferase and SGNH-hydrolase domains [Treponema bryantii]|uniref:Peptidoglycan/LPS O-acetylase OafA/YrhL, contains acyltransferase and SGNH-hydrolase domains n=1 Tax=Treponema bryantii TaxID=163 RepID=A0A1H9CDZ9_9SPIR|nr:acyltransferase [Treponema bryantii]SEP99460.1 Peptidoglycan/LPS O-acetylase OafA/YrhL, contains acyltransferase and SGNH-hydrolase domains [Treponema bryantii]
MYLTYTVYALMLALFIWGGKFAGFKNDQFHEDSSSLDSMKSLRGFAAIGVILHHISQEQAFQQAGGYQKPGEMSIFVNAGFLFVAIFFFCSGYGLIKSLETKPDYLNGFMKKRVLKALVIPYYVSILIYGILRFVSGERFAPVQWVTNLLGVSMMNPYAWYPIIAGILYTAFYLIFKNIKNRKVCYLLMAVVILLLGMIFCVNGHFPWFAGPKNWWLSPSSPLYKKWWAQQQVWWLSGEWWINSCPALFIGMLFAHYEANIREWFKKFYWGKLVLVLVITFGTFALAGYGQMRFGWWSEWSGRGPDIDRKIATYFCVIPYSMMFAIFLYTIMLKYKVSNPVSRFFGKYSLETYMMNLIAITAFRFLLYRTGGAPVYKAGHYNLAIYFAAVFAVTILLGLLYKFLCGLLQKKL